MRSLWIRSGPKSNDTRPYERKEDTERPEKGGPHEDTGRDRTRVAMSQGAPSIASHHQKPGEEVMYPQFNWKTNITFRKEEKPLK